MTAKFRTGVSESPSSTGAYQYSDIVVSNVRVSPSLRAIGMPTPLVSGARGSIVFPTGRLATALTRPYNRPRNHHTATSWVCDVRAQACDPRLARVLARTSEWGCGWVGEGRWGFVSHCATNRATRPLHGRTGAYLMALSHCGRHGC